MYTIETYREGETRPSQSFPVGTNKAEADAKADRIVTVRDDPEIESTGIADFDRIEIRWSDPDVSEADGRTGWVNAYAVTRHYGGPQEGGWWWNRLECIASAPYRGKAESEMLRHLMVSNLGGQAEGDIYSVLGGVSIDVYVEDARAESETLTSGGYQ